MGMKRFVQSTSHLFLLSLLCFGCTANILAVREFSKATVNASDTFSTVAGDIPQSCMRRVETAYQDHKIVVKDDTVEYTEAYLSNVSTCRKLRSSVDGIERVNVVLKNYAEALGSLAADEPVTFTAEVRTLKTSLDNVEIKGKKALDENKVSATSDLAAYLFSAASKGYRQKKLKETIKDNQANIEQLIQGLIDTIGDYNAELRSEEIQVTSIQDDLVAENAKPQADRRISDAVLNERLFETKKHLEMIETKKAAAKDCVAILQSIADSHKKLAENIDKLDTHEMVKMIQEYSEGLAPLITSVRNAYSS